MRHVIYMEHAGELKNTEERCDEIVKGVRKKEIVTLELEAECLGNENEAFKNEDEAFKNENEAFKKKMGDAKERGVGSGEH